MLAQATYGRVLVAINAFAAAESALREADGLARAPSVPFETRTAVRAALLEALSPQNQKGHEAEPLAREHIDDLRQRYGDSHPRLVPAGAFLVRALTEQLKYEEAVAAAEDQVRLHEALYGTWHVATGTAVVALAVAYDRAARDDKSGGAAIRAFEIFNRVLGPDHPRTMGALRNVAIGEQKNGRFADALVHYKQIHENHRRALGELNRGTISALAQQVTANLSLRRVADARAVATEVLALYERAIAAGDVDPAMLVDFATFLVEVEPTDLRRPRRAIELYQRAVDLTHRKDLQPLCLLALAYDDVGDQARALEIATEAMTLPEALESWTTERLIVKALTSLHPDRVEPWLLERLERLKRERGPNEYFLTLTLNHLATCYIKAGRRAEAEARLREALDVLSRAVPSNHHRVASTQSDLGELLLARGAFTEAEPLLLAGFEGMLTSRRSTLQRRAQVRDRVVRLYEAMNRPAEAKKYREFPIPTFGDRP